MPSRPGLQPQQVPQASLEAEYPLTLAITVAGALAGASDRVPDPPVRRVRLSTAGLRLDLAAGAWLDRDVVILVTPSEPRPSLVIQAHDTVSQAAPVVRDGSPAAARCGSAREHRAQAAGGLLRFDGRRQHRFGPRRAARCARRPERARPGQRQPLRLHGGARAGAHRPARRTRCAA